MQQAYMLSPLFGTRRAFPFGMVHIQQSCCTGIEFAQSLNEQGEL